MRCRLCRYIRGINERRLCECIHKERGGCVGCVGVYTIKERLREMCILRWSKVAARPSGWCRTYKAKEQKAWL